MDRDSRILKEAEDVLGSFVTDDGQVKFDAPAHLVTAKPAETRDVARALEDSHDTEQEND